jgi:WD40 repeat protein
VLILRGHTDAVRCLSYSPDGRYLATGSEDKTARLWDLAASGTLDATLEHSSSVETLAFATDDQVLLTGTSDGKLLVWDLASRRLQISTEAHREGVRYLFPISDIGYGEKIVTAGWDRRVMLWSYPTLQQDFVVPDVPACEVLSWASLRRRLAIGGADSSIVLYDVETKSPGRSFGSLLPLSALAWSPDARLLAWGHADGTLRVTQIPLSKGVTDMRGHTWTVYSLAFTPDGRTLISGSADGTVRQWDVASGRERRCYRWHTSWVTCVAVAPDGMTAAAGSADHTIVVWDLDE